VLGEKVLDISAEVTTVCDFVVAAAPPVTPVTTVCPFVVAAAPPVTPVTTV